MQCMYPMYGGYMYAVYVSNVCSGGSAISEAGILFILFVFNYYTFFTLKTFMSFS